MKPCCLSAYVQPQVHFYAHESLASETLSLHISSIVGQMLILVLFISVLSIFVTFIGIKCFSSMFFPNLLTLYVHHSVSLSYNVLY